MYQNAGKYQVLSLEAILSTDTGISKPNNILKFQDKEGICTAQVRSLKLNGSRNCGNLIFF